MNSKNNPPRRGLPPPTREQVEALAHALWEDRGCPTGSDLDNWLDAERMLRGEMPMRRIAAGHIPADPANPNRDPAVDGDELEAEIESIARPPQQRSPTAL